MTEIKAKFAQPTAKQGKTVLQFELDEACGWALPQLVEMAGSQVIVTIDDPQMRIDQLQAESDAEQEPLPIGGLLPEQAKAIEVADAEWEAEEAADE